MISSPISTSDTRDLGAAAEAAVGARLRESETILRNCYVNAPVMMGVIETGNHDILHVSANMAAAQFFEKTTETIQGQLSSQLGVSEDQIQRWVRHCHKSERTGGPSHFEYANGSGLEQKWLSVTVCFLERISGGPAHFTYIMEDVSDRKLGAEARARLLKTVIAVQEDERRRVARELHDGISQTLMSLLLKIRLVESASTLDEGKEHARHLQDVVQSAAREVRRLARGLHPAVLDKLGLAAALERYVTEFQQVHGIQVDTHFLNIASARLPSSVETTLYRILQEALTNTAKHADAKTISIVVEHRPASVEVIIEDDGRGFDTQAVFPKEDSAHLGMSTMRERAALLNGSFSIESRPGLGTIVNVCIPLEENVHGEDSSPDRG